MGRRLAPNAVPVICGDFERPDLIKLKSFFTALAVTSGCELCLIVGVSPEAQTYEMAMGGHEPAAEFTITNEILQSYWDEICCKESGPADYLQIGCPNCSAEELIRIWRYMHGRKVKEGVERGRGIADSMEGVECFPKMLTEMVAVGERSGSLEETLDVIGDYFDHEAATMTERLLAVLEPVIIIVLAAVTVMLLLAVYLPMFSMYGSM